MTNVLFSRGVACSVNDLIHKIDVKMSEMGCDYLKIHKYDLKNTLSTEDMYLLVQYKKMLLNKLLFCSDCFSEHNKQEISSKILRIIY